MPKGKQTEPRIKWRHSRAQALLYDDVEKGIIQFDDDNQPLMSLEEIYAMHPKYLDYLFVNFERRLNAIRDLIDTLIGRADDDIMVPENFMENHEISQVNWLGMIQWQGSEAQEYVIQDIEKNMHVNRGYRFMYDQRPEYFMYFDYKTFKQKVRQEVRTKKYSHTLDVQNLLGKKAT